MNINKLNDDSAIQENSDVYKFRYEKSQEIGHVGNWEYDIETKTFWGSNEAKRIYGFKLDTDNFTTDEVENCILERKKVHQALIDLVEKNKPYDIEFEINPIDSSEKRYIKSVAEVTHFEDGQARKIMGVIQDITREKLIKDKLLESEEKFRSYIDCSPIGIFIVDQNGKYIDMNPAASKQTGYSRNELLKMNIADLVENKKSSESSFLNLLQTGKIEEIMTYITKQKKKKQWILSAVKLSQNKYIGFTTEISADMKIQELLKDKDEQIDDLRLIAENVSDVIWIMDLKMNFLFITPSVKDLTGHSVEEFVNTNLSEHATKKEFVKMSWEIAKALKNILSFKQVLFETKVLHKDGHEVPVEILGKIFKDENGHANKIHGVTRNISERKKTQTALREKIDELEKFNQVTVGREMKMIELKEKNERLKKLLTDNNISF